MIMDIGQEIRDRQAESADRARRGSGKGNGSSEAPPDPKRFNVQHWLERKLPPPSFLLGDLLSTTTRAELIGPTGCGKTHFSVALNFAMATERGFLHWKARKSTGSLVYIDGEMSARRAQKLLAEAATRHGAKPDRLIFINRYDFPGMPAINTQDGMMFMNRLFDQIGDVCHVTFDNLQSLTLGVTKEEETWKAIQPWTVDLTRREIGQLWVHHTGQDETHGYGTKTIEWQMDLVMIMKDRRDTENESDLIKFDLEFSKAREREPQNRADFATASIWMSPEDKWESPSTPAAKSSSRISPRAKSYYDALCDEILRRQDELPFAGASPRITRAQWQGAVIRRGLLTPEQPSNVQSAHMSKYQAELVDTGLVRVEGEYVSPVRGAR